MSKIVEIPNDRKPFVVIVNGVRYEYPAGENVEVPDSVADVIEKYLNAKPKPDPNAGGCTCGGSGGGDSGGSSEEWIGDGNTHIWITLQEGRTSPMLGVCPKGTVTVDWGDGTTPDVLTGTSTSTVKWTPTHNYAKHGDYVITLTVDGEMGLYGSQNDKEYAGILRHSSGSDARNCVYQCSIKQVELGDGVTNIGYYAFSRCYSLTSIAISGSVTTIGDYAFVYCYSLTSIAISDGVTDIGSTAFSHCYSLKSIAIPDGVTRINSGTLSNCYTLTSIAIPDGVTRINYSAFTNCYTLTSIAIPDGVTYIGNDVFTNCYLLTSIAIPGSVTEIGSSAFARCLSLCYVDFTNHTAVPALSSTSTFTGIPTDCEIRVPAALYDQWKAATNWTTYASQIVRR